MRVWVRLICSTVFWIVVLGAMAQLGWTRSDGGWELLETNGEPHARHEAAFVEFEGKFYLLGGRRIQPVSIYDPQTNRWIEGSPPPIEIHHFQPVAYKKRIHLVSAMTGPYPNEYGLDRVLTYIPSKDEWEFTHTLPDFVRPLGLRSHEASSQ